jgi:hypothetical protein
MTITEITNEHALTIKPLKASSDDILKHIEMPLMNNTHFFYILNGKPASGKSTMMMNLITQRKAYRKQFNTIFIVSPSLINIRNNPLDELPDDQKFDDLNIEVLEEIEGRIKGSGDKVLLILDDCAAQMKNNDIQKTLMRFIFNRRHICSDGETGSLSIIITTQVYNKIPLDIRKCADILFQWRTLNKKEMSFIKDEYLNSIPDDKLEEILKYTFKKPNDCLMIRLNDHLDNMLWRNFNRLVWQDEGATPSPL